MATPIPAFMSFGFAEILLVAVVALLVFGGNLPDVMRNLGRSYAKLRQSLLAPFGSPVRPCSVWYIWNVSVVSSWFHSGASPTAVLAQ